jgi:hypothetical protein
MTQNKNKIKILKEETEMITEREEDKWERNAKSLPIFYWTD